MKLCDLNVATEEHSLPVSLPVEVQETDSLDSDMEQLSAHVVAYESLTTVYGAVANESFNFVDAKNYTLFNEYMKLVSKNLGVSSVPLVSLEAIEVLPTVALNHHLALEGFIGDMWAKVKALFVKIYESIKAFFAKHFTRLGRLKGKLQNLQKVLKDTDKDLKQVSLETVPSNIASKFPFNGTVGEGLVGKVVESCSVVVEILETVNKDATKLADRDVLSRDFVAKVKGLKEQIGAIDDKVSENNANRTTGLKRFGKEGRENNKAIKKENAELKDKARGTGEALKAEEGKLEGIVKDKGNAGAELDDQEFSLAQKELSRYISKVEESFRKLINKPMAGGKVLKEVKVTQDDGIELEFDTQKDTPSDVTLGSRTSLVKLVDLTLSQVVAVEEVAKSYGKINDKVMSNLVTVEKLIADLEKVTGKNEAAYKKILQNKVKERLKLMQVFFTNYNKVNKGLMSSVVDVGDAVVAYTVTSLKYFG